MSAKSSISLVKGFVHDVDTLAGLDLTQSNIRLLSDSSLYILQNLSGLDATFLTRYGVILDNNQYLPVQQGSAQSAIVETAVDALRRDLQMTTIEDTLTCICEQLSNIASGISGASGVSCGCQIGTDVDSDSGEEGGVPPGEVNGVPYEEPSAIPDRKCIAANYIHFGVADIVTELNLSRADQYGYAGLAFVLELVSTVVGGLVAGPIGILIGAAVGGLLDVALALFKASFDLGILATAMRADDQEAVCALYSATDADGARTAYKAVLTANGATSAELAFIDSLLPNNLLNLLFFGWGDSEAELASYVPVIDCDLCFAEDLPWSFQIISSQPMGTGSLVMDDSVRTLSSVPRPGASTHVVFIQLPDDPPYGNRDIEVKNISGWTNFPTATNYCTCRRSGGGATFLYNNGSTGDPPPLDTVFNCWNITMSSATPFTVDIILYDGPSDPPC